MTIKNLRHVLLMAVNILMKQFRTSTKNNNFPDDHFITNPVFQKSHQFGCHNYRVAVNCEWHRCRVMSVLQYKFDSKSL